MRNEWESDLRTLEMVQADLRRRLEGLDQQIMGLRARMDTDAPPLPATPSPVDTPAEVAPARPVGMRPPPLPVDLSAMPQVEAGGAEPSFPSVQEPAVPPPIPAKPEENLEMRVGQYWLVRIGILVLLTGLVLLGNLAYQNFITKLGAPGKLALLYLAGGALTWLGIWLERRRVPMRNYARVLMAGGAATLYYTTYAAHFVAPLRVIENPLLGGAALLLLAGGLVWFAQRRKSETVAFTAVLLAYYSSAINSAANFTLFSNIVLTGVAVFLLARHRWFGVSWLGLVGSYVSFAYWRWQAGDAAGRDFWFTHGFLAAYWVIFTVAVFLHRGGAFQKAHREAFLTANNAAFFALIAPAFHARYPEQFWIFALLFGTVLLILSAIARRMRRDDFGFDGAYLAQGLIIFTVGLIARFSGYQLAIVLGVESTALLFLSQFRHQQLFRIASGLTSFGAFCLVLEDFGGLRDRAWLVGAFVSALLVGNAALLKHLRGALVKLQWTWGAAGYGWAGLILLGVTLENRFDGNTLIWVLLGVAVVGTVALRLHRLPEIAVGVQTFLAAAALALLPAMMNEGLGWSNALPVMAVALLLMHWWQRQTLFAPSVGQVLQGVDALISCGVLALWLSPDLTGDSEMLPLALAGLGVLIYGLVTRAWFLAVLSQLFTFGAVGWCFRALIWGDAPWQLTLGTIAVVAVQAAAGWGVPERGRPTLRPLLLGYRAILLLLSVAWLLAYLPDSTRFLIFTLAGLLVFIPAALRKNHEYLIHAAVLTGVGIVCYVITVASQSSGSGSDFLALVLLLGLHQAGKKLLAGTGLFPTEVQGALAVAALLGLWYESSRWAWESPSGIAPTIVWALLAFAALGTGFLLRERVYRLMGLLILAVAVGHVFFVDVWKMGQFAGILGIIGLALVLLALGFIYNRFAEQIKKWL